MDYPVILSLETNSRSTASGYFAYGFTREDEPPVQPLKCAVAHQLVQVIS